MIIHNATFMIVKERESEFVDWFRENVGMLGELRDPRLSAMREAGGVDYRQAEAQSVAFQCEFASIGEARLWSAGRFAELAALFEERFGPEAMVFTSLFEIL